MLCVTLGRTLVAIAFTLHCSCIRHWHRRDGRDAVSAQDAAWNAPASIMRLVSRRDGRSRRRPHYQHIPSIVRLVLRMGSSASPNDHWHFPVAPGGFHLRLACLILRDRYEQLRRDRQWSGRMARGDGGKGLGQVWSSPITNPCPARHPSVTGEISTGPYWTRPGMRDAYSCVRMQPATPAPNIVWC